MSQHAFSASERAAVYRAIDERRDMRHFNSLPVAEDVLMRILAAGHAAPSVGLMQPWRMIRITQSSLRKQLRQCVDKERLATAKALNEREKAFLALKVEGMDHCAEVLVVSLMDKREPHIFGRRTLPEMDLASVSCAIQNMWLAARAEGVGMGWVSLFDPADVAKLLEIPADAKPVAILCIGHVDAFYPRPMLEQEGWREPDALADLLWENRWEHN
ncbi:5,6-dimethylbenzimidazole synthase [Neptunomonas sp. XY-337]|uniref:5,6-dimethylbenzimidazole synthase n=1 Tax=Neptunomonas sp. XY-337 TaxID=2561897 RepID=UPI0010A9A4A1|nr:5,6-dimethylbenzimidazole synthase [Neptunomonas sp. XY-337]